MKITQLATLTLATTAQLPKDVTVLTDSTPDGVYVLIQEHIIPYDRYGTGLRRASKANRTIKAGTVIISTENNHWYKFSEDKGLVGLGKRSGAVLFGAAIQRVKLTEFCIGPYTKPRAPAKKKVAKKGARK